MIVASRYAKSLMDLAVETNQLEAVRKDMKAIQKVCNESHEFELFLNSPILKKDKKQAVLKAMFEGKISKASMGFLNLLTVKNRESYLKDIATAFDEQYKSNQNIYTAVITSAMGLDQKTKEKVLDLVKSQLKGEVELVEKIDKSTIGGFVLKIGDKQLDRSVSRQLSNLRKELTNKELN
jgi:F-type H+-transporting ATPase subunit delta